jgi:hypothetical protein
MCLEREPRRTAFKKKNTHQKIPRQMSRFAVIFGFFGIFAATQEILLQSREHRGPNLIFMSSKHPPPSLGLKNFHNTLRLSFWVNVGQKR